MLKNYQEMLEYTFDVLNEHFFQNELPEVVITIMSSPRSNGHFTITKEWRLNEDYLHEINISAAHLDRPIENIAATLMHEMTHYFCRLHGINDTSQGHRYHNKRFKKEAEARGLIIEYAQGIGYSVTKPSQEFIEVIKSHGIEKPLDINRDGALAGMLGITGGNGNGIQGGSGGGGAVKKPKCSTRKYICPKCNNSFRATKDINVMCMDCLEQFVKVEK